MLTRIKKYLRKQIKNLLRRAVAKGIDDWLNKSPGGYDFWKIGSLVAAADTFEFFQTHMSTAPLYDSRIELHKAAFKAKSLEGLILEFGVAGGMTINRIASLDWIDCVVGARLQSLVLWFAVIPL